MSTEKVSGFPIWEITLQVQEAKGTGAGHGGIDSNHPANDFWGMQH